MDLTNIPKTLGRFTRGALLGRGGMGAVFRAHDPQLGRDIALKVLLASDAGEDGDRKRFVREIKALAAIQDPGVIRIYDFEIEQDWYYFTMELLEGRTLADIIDQDGRQSTAFLVTLGRRLAVALQAIHAAGMIHRDIKPQNIFIGHDGRVTLMDLGLVKTTNTTVLTADGQMMGTPRYLAPEILCGSPTTPLSDIYQIGLVLYEAATGQRPFPAHSIPEMVSQVLRGIRQRPRELCRDIPAPFEALILDATSTEPSRRPASALDLERRLQALEERTPAMPPASGQPLGRVARSGPGSGSREPRRALPHASVLRRVVRSHAPVAAGLVTVAALLVIVVVHISSPLPSRPPAGVASQSPSAIAGETKRRESPFDRPCLSNAPREAFLARFKAISREMSLHTQVEDRYLQETLMGSVDGIADESRRFRDRCAADLQDVEALRRDSLALIPSPDRASPSDAALWVGLAAYLVLGRARAEHATTLLELSRSVRAREGEAFQVWERARTETRYGTRVADALAIFASWVMALLSASAAEPGRAGPDVIGTLSWVHSVSENLQDGMDRSDALKVVVRDLKARLARLDGPVGPALGRLTLALWNSGTADSPTMPSKDAIEANLADIHQLRTMMPQIASLFDRFLVLLHAQSAKERASAPAR